MAWFNRKVAAEPARPALMRTMGQAWFAGERPASYEAQLREAYLGNGVAQRSVRLVAEGAGSVPVYQAGEDQSAAALVMRPACGQRLIETAATHLLLHGNAYLQIGLDADARPAMLYPLRPERVTIEQDASGWPAAFIYRAGDNRARLPTVDGDGRPTVIHIRTTNPADDHYGLGCLGAAGSAVALHNAATRWNKALLDNAARPSGALVYDPGEAGATLTPDQFARLRDEIEASFAGAANAGRPMLLEGGLKWQALGLTPADMDFVGLKSAAAREIALAFGVPPMLLGLPGDSTYANYREANLSLWRLTVLPLAQRLLDGLADGLSGWWPGLALAIDLDAVPALAEDRQRLWAMAAGADFLSTDEKREMLGFGAST